MRHLQLLVINVISAPDRGVAKLAKGPSLVLKTRRHTSVDVLGVLRNTGVSNCIS